MSALCALCAAILTGLVVSTSTAPTHPARELTPYEAYLYGIGIRAQAAKDGAETELAKCKASLATSEEAERRSTDESQRLLLDLASAPPVPDDRAGDDRSRALFALIAGGIGGGVGAWAGGEIDGTRFGVVTGATIGAAGLGVLSYVVMTLVGAE